MALFWIFVFLLIANSSNGKIPIHEYNKYALLVGGGTQKRDTLKSHYHNIYYVYNSLIKTGYKMEKITILFYGGKTTDHSIVKTNATKSNFLEELRKYETIMNSKDSLLIFRSGHGMIEPIFEKHGILFGDESIPEGESIKIVGSSAVMCFPDGSLSELEFQERLGNIKAKQIIVILNQCFSGRFTEITKNLNNAVVISETDQAGLGFMSKKYTNSWKSSVWPFVKCIFDGLLVNQKENQKQSIIEAFQYMLTCNPNIEGIGFRADRPILRESPQISYGSDLKIGTVYIH